VYGLTSLIEWAIDIATIIFSIFAFIDVARRRSDAFPAVDRQTKPLWLGLTGGAALVSLATFNPLGLLGIAAIVVTAVYLLDVRKRIIEITGGR
jgi:Protein of unknown function (DUF2516)